MLMQLRDYSDEATGPGFVLHPPEGSQAGPDEAAARLMPHHPADFRQPRCTRFTGLTHVSYRGRAHQCHGVQKHIMTRGLGHSEEGSCFQSMVSVALAALFTHLGLSERQS